MSKEYGLILSGQQKKTVPPARPTSISRPSIFDESSDNSDDDAAAPSHLKAKATAPMAAPGLMERRIARRVQEKALEEDPTVFQYDEHYDKMETQREEEQSKCKDPKKPKYIGRLMEFAERRKLENELRVERQVQKDREEEGEQFKGKESFVTSAYRKKLEEMRQLEEAGKREDYLEAIGDVTKQKDLDGFYRHLYEQKLGTAKAVTKPAVLQKSDSEEEVAYKPIKSGKPKQRAYRKRRSSDEEDEETQSTDVPAVAVAKKVHLTNNIDADSDFSIDSSTDDDDKDEDVQKNVNASKSKIDIKTAATATQVDSKTTALNFEKMRKETSVDAKKSENEEKTKDKMTPPTAPTLPALQETPIANPKRDKTEIWKKRTVGDVLVAALQRYNERKIARNA